MKRVFLILLAGCGSSLPQPEFERFDVRVTATAEDHPDVPAVVLLDRGTLHMTVDAKRILPIGRLRHYHRVKVLRESGLGRKVVVVPYNEGEAIYGLQARAVTPEGEVWYADPGEVKDLEAPDGRRAKSIEVPKLEPGWVVEHTYDRYLQDLRFVEPWVFQADIPTVRSEFAVVAPPGFLVDVRFSRNGEFVNEPPERFDTPEGTRFFWSAKNVPARFDEPNMPSRNLLAPRAHVVFRIREARREDRHRLRILGRRRHVVPRPGSGVVEALGRHGRRSQTCRGRELRRGESAQDPGGDREGPRLGVRASCPGLARSAASPGRRAR